MVIDDSVESALRKQHCDVRAHAARCAGYQDHAVLDFAQNWTLAREFRTSCHGSVANHAGFRKDGRSTGQESTCKKTRNRQMREFWDHLPPRPMFSSATPRRMRRLP